MNFEPDPNI